MNELWGGENKRRSKEVSVTWPLWEGREEMIANWTKMGAVEIQGTD